MPFVGPLDPINMESFIKDQTMTEGKQTNKQTNKQNKQNKHIKTNNQNKTNINKETVKKQKKKHIHTNKQTKTEKLFKRRFDSLESKVNIHQNDLQSLINRMAQLEEKTKLLTNEIAKLKKPNQNQNEKNEL